MTHHPINANPAANPDASLACGVPVAVAQAPERLTAVPIQQVAAHDGFWTPRIRAWKATINDVIDNLDDSFSHTVFNAVCLLVAATGHLPAAEPPPGPPDLTQNPEIDRKLTYNLGATGLRGWIFTKAADFFESQQGRTTTASRQILVTHVGAKSPADGLMQVNDVILGVGGRPFAFDARQSIAKAIQDAETAEHGGTLQLTRWRAGQVAEVQLKLRVMGTYSATAPYNCPKSKLILEDACKVLEKEPLEDNWHGAINALALMATGEAKYIPRIREHAHKMGPETVKIETTSGMVIWDWGYRNLFLCEYFLLTGDKAVLPAIHEYTVALAKGQSMYGTIGHGISQRNADGSLHGSIPPYGPVNAAGLVGNIAIVMGSKCGVIDPEVNPAIERAANFFRYYVDKGAIPYGEHAPWMNHENNGKNAMAAILFAMQGTNIPETRYFAKMVTASYQNREYGHTGQGFSYLWGALGANTGGPDALAAYFKKASWHFDLVRRCDGSFTYDGGEQYGPGQTDDNTYYGKSSYNGLSPAATYVLTYSLPLKKLWITGKAANQADWLSRQDVNEAIASGCLDTERKTLGTEELITALGDWSPVARGWAAEELARRSNGIELQQRLIALAEGRDARQRQGAAEALGDLKSREALPVLVRLLSHDDRWLRFKAAEAIRKLGGEAAPAVPAILTAVAQTAEPLQPINWADPIQLAHGQLAATLFDGPLQDVLKSTQRSLLYPTIRAISRNADGMARATLRGYFQSHLTETDVVALAPEILAAVRTRCPADTMFGNEIRMGGLRALAKFHFEEAIDAGVVFAQTQGGHGSENRTGEIMREITSYGTAAQRSIPALKGLINEFNAQCQRGEYPAGELNARRVGAVEDAIKSITAATSRPVLRSTTPPLPVKGVEPAGR